jgi:hypothetical protein
MSELPSNPVEPVTGEVQSSSEREEARKLLQARRDFAANIFSYVVINGMLTGIWAFSGRGYFWPAWVMIAWGAGLVFHAWDAFWRRPITDSDIDREIARRRRWQKPPHALSS